MSSLRIYPFTPYFFSAGVHALSIIRRFTPVFLLSAAALLIWCAVTHRWSSEAWSTPMQIHGDPLEVYARIQAAMEDPTQPLRGFSSLPRLGMPVGADWQRYPISDRVVFTVVGLLARVVGVFAALNVAVAAVHVLNAVAFYLCARFLRWRREWAMATALLFSFCSYNFRWSVTLSFSLTFFVPVLLLLCAWIARPAPAVAAKRWTWIAIALAAWLGGANPYLSFFATQLILGSVGLQLLRRRELARWRVGVFFIAILAISFVVQHAAYFVADVEGEGRLTLSRNYAGSEIYALKLADLFVPDLEHPDPVDGKSGPRLSRTIRASRRILRQLPGHRCDLRTGNPALDGAARIQQPSSSPHSGCSSRRRLDAHFLGRRRDQFAPRTGRVRPVSGKQSQQYLHPGRGRLFFLGCVVSAPPPVQLPFCAMRYRP